MCDSTVFIWLDIKDSDISHIATTDTHRHLNHNSSTINEE